ncbi:MULTISPECIES: acyl-CoA dehydrogenase family protein [Sphingobium]|uniref:acyl-CoA dehydrogenase family protein n=1 Tax=Sphingobium TaxID=165695 RepID=UPI00036F7B54|nr:MULTISPECIES: acyl-CoA dehydrogenase family protein [Sphingobium]
MIPDIQSQDPGTIDIVDRLAILGARYDAAPNFPCESMSALIESGHHRWFAPQICGGLPFEDEAARCRAMAQALREVGRGDLSIARLYEGHVNALSLFEWYGVPDQFRWLANALDRGAWFGVWATEPSPGVRLTRETVPSLLGEKIFASGAGGLDYALVTAASEGEHRRLVIVRADEKVRADLSGWRVRGMRASVSGRYVLDDVTVEPDMLLGKPGDYDQDPRFTAGAWRFCAAQLGGIEALVTEIRRSMRDAAREDPVQRARFADATVAVRTAGFWVAEAAQRFASGHDDAVAVARMTRGVVEDAGFIVMEAAARILGTQSALDGQRADKIVRDLSLYLRQAGPDHARDEAAKALLDHDIWVEGERLW